MERGAAYAAPYEGGGAGGKFRKRPSRKASATPYDRPPLPRESSSRQRDGWFSRLADPASRLITRGATRLFPSLFSKSPSSSITDSVTRHEASDELPKDSSSSQISDSDDERGHCEAERLKGSSDGDEINGDKNNNSHDGSGLSEIEQLFQQKTFSRDEFNRLTEILRTRTTDIADNDRWGKSNPNMVAAAKTAEGALGQENLRKFVEEKQSEQLGNKLIMRTPDPPMRLTLTDEVGASPVDIARAFMEARTSSLNLSSQSVVTKDERQLPCSDGFATSSSIPSTPLKSPICWPGAMLQEAPGYLTPQTQRGRIRLNDLPRSPYHRAVHSRSITKGFGERSINLHSTRSKQPQTPVFGSTQVRKSYTLEDGFASIRSIHRKPQKSMETATPMGAGLSHPVSPGLLPSSSSSAFEGITSTVPENMDTIAAKSNITKLQTIRNKGLGYGVGSAVHPHSSATARRILENLDRTIPSPAEKANELKLSVLGQKPAPRVGAGKPNGQHSQHDTTLGSLSSGHLLFQDHCSQANGDARKDALLTKDEDGKAEKAGVSHVVSRNTGISASNIFSNKHEVFAKLPCGESEEKNQLSLPHNHIDDKGIPWTVSIAACSDGLQIAKSQPQSSANKPVLASLSIMKPNGKHAISSDSGSGFTFPVSASSVPLSEPPTPTMMSSLINKSSQPKEGSTIPSFTFGSSNAAKSPVFSFPSSVSSTIIDASIPKFNFGSEKKKVSFR